jgi:hypothetical protein
VEASKEKASVAAPALEATKEAKLAPETEAPKDEQKSESSSEKK